MKTDPIDLLFQSLEGQFDIHTPNDGHVQRFFQKLEQNKSPYNIKSRRSFNRAYLTVAASIILCFGLFMILNPGPKTMGLAGVSPQLSQTEAFFTMAINHELEKIKAQKTPDNQTLIVDALNQLKILEENYKLLTIDLRESGNDKRVINAMIGNFQSRINILENVLQIIDQQKAYKRTEHNQT